MPMRSAHSRATRLARDNFRSIGRIRAMALVLAAAASLAACAVDRGSSDGPRARTTAPSDMIAVFSTGTVADLPVRAVLGKVSSHSCRYPYTPSAADADAVLQLKDRAARLGANGVVDVAIERFQNNGGRNPCWRGSRAVGTAVLFADNASEKNR